ncbi:MAG: hypothetical protein GWM92_09935 [Gemmatimonadetes bacterium]|nr:hypothetical protein [Gemmatimonadota bacterium]NIR78982.1 hypothetical protein [Gemmatimonadota bacterium]NIT87631.1 hypothetical protein [Gemmatimonadota bacterium]NIU31493.1 hypothetical protein [Gemmatimonadota bacterium]NIU36160.1 hypothetical protein [Gemmatimonadota bacterium]
MTRTAASVTPSGTVELAGRTWEWGAEETPRDSERDPVPYLTWYRVLFRRSDDPEQLARARAGIPPDGWSERTLRSVLRAAREVVWRDGDGRLWELRVEGWAPGQEEAESGERRVVLSPAHGGEGAPTATGSLEHPAGGLRSLTAASDEALQDLLDSAAPA